MKLYKLTDEKMQTYKNTQWELGVTKRARSGNAGLCSNKWLHAYEHPLIAVMMSPIHTAFQEPRLFEAKHGRKILRDGQLKCGAKSLTLLREITLPTISTDQRVEIAIRCVKMIWNDADWNTWANHWIDGSDRSRAATTAATNAISAAYASNVAAGAAGAAYATTAAICAINAAAGAAGAINAAARAANGSELDMLSIIEQVCGKWEVVSNEAQQNM